MSPIASREAPALCLVTGNLVYRDEEGNWYWQAPATAWVGHFGWYRSDYPEQYERWYRLGLIEERKTNASDFGG